MTDNHPDDQKSSATVDRRGTSWLVPFGIGVVFVILAIAWVSMSGHDDASSPKDLMTRPNSPTRTP
jgi:hypothetical protein